MAVMAKKSKKAKSGVEPSPEAALGDIDATVEAEVEVKPEAVSYTHLTLPTILLV